MSDEQARAAKALFTLAAAKLGMSEADRMTVAAEMQLFAEAYEPDEAIAAAGRVIRAGEWLPELSYSRK